MKKRVKSLALIFTLTFILTTSIFPKSANAAVTTVYKQMTLKVKTPSSFFANKGNFSVTLYKNTVFLGKKNNCSSGVKIPLTLSYPSNVTSAKATLEVTVTFNALGDLYSYNIPINGYNLKNGSTCTLTLSGNPYINDYSTNWN